MSRSSCNLTAAQVLYPLMQCADFFHLQVDVCQLGMDQLKVNVLARENCDKIANDDLAERFEKEKPVIISNP